MGAPNFFLCFVVPLSFFNYFGSLYHSESGLIPVVEILFFIFLAHWCIAMALWAGYKLFQEDLYPKRRENGGEEESRDMGLGGLETGEQRAESVISQEVGNLPASSNKRTRDGREEQENGGKRRPKKEEGSGKWSRTSIAKLVFYIVGLVAPIVFLPLWVTDTLPQAFLLTCISESSLVIFWKAMIEVIRLCNRGCKNMTKKEKSLIAGQLFYILIAVGITITALVFFICMPSTNKTKTPEKSRDLNHECVDVFGFFDYHDIWHILSSFALLMGAHLVVYISYEPPTKTESSGGGYGSNQESQSACQVDMQENGSAVPIPEPPAKTESSGGEIRSSRWVWIKPGVSECMSGGHARERKCRPNP